MPCMPFELRARQFPRKGFEPAGGFPLITAFGRSAIAFLLLVFVYCAAPRAAANSGIALVQRTCVDAGTTSSAVLSFASNNTAGNWIAVVVRAGTQNETFTVGDSKGNTYKKAFQFNETNDGNTLAMFYAENIGGGANSITVSETVSTSLRLVIFEYSGIATSGSLDTTMTGQGNSGTASSGNLTTTVNGDLLLGAILTANAESYTAGTGYQTEESVPGSPNTKLIAEDQIQGSAGSVSATASLGSSDVWAAGLAAFKPANGGIGLVQHTSIDAGTTTSMPLSFASNNTTGNWIAVVIRAGTQNETFTVTDTKGNTYKKAFQFNETNDGNTLAIFYAESIGGGANTVTVSQSVSTTLRFAILEYSGVATSGSLDVTVTSQGNSGSASSGNLTPTANGDLLLGAVLTADPETYTAGSSYNIEESVPASPNTKLIAEDQIQGSAASVSASATLGSSDIWAAGLAAFKPANAVVVVAPTISNLSPNSGPVGNSVVITGSNFGASGTVTFNNTTATTTNWTSTSITAKVPSGATTGSVVVTTGGLASNGVTFTITAIANISLVQHTSMDAGTTTLGALSFASNNTAGNWIGVVIRAGTPNETFSVSDSKGNTYHNAFQFNETNDGNTLAIFYAESVGGGANTVTVSQSVSTTLRFAILEYSGVATSASLDVSVTGQGSGSTASSGNLTPTVNGDLLLGALMTADPESYTAATGFKIEESVPASPNAKLVAEDQVQSNATSVAASATLGSSDIWAAGVAAFKAATSVVGVAPSITNLSPNSGPVGTPVVISGTNLGTSGTVKFNNTTATTTSWTPSSITATVPTGATTGSVVVTTGGLSSNGMTFTVTTSAPTISSLSLTSGPVGTTVIVNGTNFGTTQGSSKVTFNGTTATATAWGTASITVTVPAGATTGNVVVTVNGQASNGVLFTVTTSGSITVSISPKRAGLTVTQTLSLIATTNDSAGVNWSANGGSFSTGSSLSGVAVTYTAPSTAGVYSITATSVTDIVVSASITVGVTDLAGVYTYHDDLARDGANTHEYTLTSGTTGNVNTSTFGKLFSCSVDGAVYAQPLWVANLTVGGVTRNVVFVATQHDSLYAFDADANPCVQLWHVSLIDSNHGGSSSETTVPSGTSGYLVGDGSGDITPEVGVTGTPVIDPATNILYVVSKSVITSGPTFYQRLHAIDLATGNEKPGSPVLITATYPGTGDGGSTDAFSARQEGQRAGLAFVNGTVYIAWASHEDKPPYYGWIIGYTYNGSMFAQTHVLNVSPNVGYGGIWMGGGAPAADGSGNLYLITGNATFDVTNTSGPTNDYGDSFLQLSASLGITSYFTPSDQSSDNSGDNDFGAGGAAVVLNLASGSPKHLVIGGGKDGQLYLLNGDSMGGFGDSNARQHFALGHGIFSTGAFWNNNYYIAGVNGPVVLFTFDTSKLMFNTAIASQSSSSFGFPGATPSVSASGTMNGIVWALNNSAYCTNQSKSCGPAVLHAYDATTLTTDLWNSSMIPADAAGNAVKFTVPIVANGKVYFGTRGNNTGGAYGSTSVSGTLEVYGLKAN